MKKAEEIYKLDALKKGTVKDALGYSPDDLSSYGEDSYSVMVSEVASGHVGIYQGTYAVDHFGIEDEIDAEDWEEGADPSGMRVLNPEAWDWSVNNAENEISAQLDSKLKLPGTFHYDWLEGDGSYGLFFSFGPDDVEGLAKIANEYGIGVSDEWLAVAAEAEAR